MRYVVRWVGVIVVLTITSAARTSPASGQIIPLDYPSSSATFGAAINANGVATGGYRVGSQSSALRWSAAGGYQAVSYPIYTEPTPRLPSEPPVVPSGTGQAISDSGIIAGLWGDFGYEIYSGFINATGTPAPIPEPANYSIYDVRGVNNSGVVVGMMEHDTSETAHAWHYNGSGAAQTFTTLGGATSSVTAINNAAVTVGAASTGSASHAVRWTSPSSPQDIHPQGVSSAANAINESGVIAGVYVLANGDSRAFRRNADGAVQTLTMLPGNIDSTAEHINENGWIIGEMSDANFLEDFVLWKPDGSVYDLHQWVNQVNPIEGNRWKWFDSLHGISDDGLIVGTGYYDDGPGGLPTGERSFVLDASSIPEPASALTAGVAAAWALRRRNPSLRRAYVTQVTIEIAPIGTRANSVASAGA